MTRFNIIFLYLALSVINGLVPPAIALWLSVPGLIVLLIWGLATIASFALICLVCLGSAIKDAVPGSERNNLSREFNEAAIYH